MDREAWHTATHGVAKSQIRLNNDTPSNFLLVWQWNSMIVEREIIFYAFKVDKIYINIERYYSEN